MTEPLKTTHKIIIGDPGAMSEIGDRSIDLVITSPPYPMIQMWDDLFSQVDPKISDALAKGNGALAFECMHQQLDTVWNEVYRILKPGGMACIIIGDATRSLNGHFQLFPNHARIITKIAALGFSQLPTILWRNPTNVPNKFMGSGMLPSGACVALEHEYILIFRKGKKRQFDQDQEVIRRQSAYFWEERNLWYSDLWFDLRDSSQKLDDLTKRSGAYPLELPLRLINMFSIHGDIIADPFLGSGTTMVASMCSARNSIGYEIDHRLQPAILETIADIPNIGKTIIRNRLDAHYRFIGERRRTKGELKHTNRPYGFPVMTRQEEDLRLPLIQNIQFLSSFKFQIGYGQMQLESAAQAPLATDATPLRVRSRPNKGRQLKLF
ncbi:MAG: site-specific DNA-methyltransferase [Desulfobacteraceae bacterium]|jgi:DNA modification methylase